MAKKNEKAKSKKNFRKPPHGQSSLKFNKCYNSNKYGHIVKYCRKPKEKDAGQASGTKDFTLVVEVFLMISRKGVTVLENFIWATRLASTFLERAHLDFHFQPVAL
ncbi:hypothetical protein AMTR_s00144p00092330 [Amborella trichopoda]|uniref:CCHC-type domain-containing protein n=1 Tax=Amborella trichopoda TaxID=13333 RepID=W1P1I9_AMBTC|nr:hypothetical protein AMTR_s00144p00092330 [Amborella trichopoda]